MANRFDRLIRRSCQYLLDRSVSLYSLDRQSWGRAAAAEVRIMPSLLATVRWTVGSLWVAFKAWMRRYLGHPSNLILGSDSLLRSGWRSLSPLFLVLSLSLFLLPQFREALRTTTSMWIAGDALPQLSAGRLASLQAAAEQQHDAQTLAFLAVRTEDKQKSARLAEEAVALDESLIWIFSEIRNWETLRAHPEWFDRLVRWDPDNAKPFLLHAQVIVWAKMDSSRQNTRAVLAGMRGGDSEFCRLMDRAFAAVRYDSYLVRRFKLDQQVMREHGMAEPMLLLAGLQTHVVPGLLELQTYTDWLMDEAKSTAANGNLPAAGEKYRQIMGFAGKMETQYSTALERAVAVGFQLKAGRELVSALRQQGKVNEAGTLEDMLRQEGQWEEREMNLAANLLDARMVLIRVNPFSTGIIIHASALLFLLALGLLAASFLYLRLRRAGATGRISLPRLVSYAPAMLFAMALVLLITYLPYARIFRLYMTNDWLVHLHVAGADRPYIDFGLLSSLSNLQCPLFYLRGSFVQEVICVAFGVVLALGLFALSRTRIAAAEGA